MIKQIKNFRTSSAIYALEQFSRTLEHEQKTLTEQRDRLAEALQKLADCDWVITLPDRMDGVRAIAREALETP